MRKIQTTTINIFLPLIFYVWKTIVYIVTFVLQFFHVVRYWKCINKTPTTIQMYIGLVDAVLGPKILGNRLDTLSQILIAMDYYFLFYISEKNL